MTTLQAANVSPGVLLVLGAAASMGPVALVVALRQRGWAPVRAARRRLSRRR